MAVVNNELVTKVRDRFDRKRLQEQFEESKSSFEHQAKNGTYAYASEWSLGDVIRDESRLMLAQDLLGTETSPNTDSEVLDAILYFVGAFHRELGHVRAESRSTSITSNLVEDIRFQVKAQAYEQLVDMGALEV